MSQPFFESHSATVHMWLDCGEHGRMPLSRVTPKMVVAKECREIPACFAELVVTVDGRRLQKSVNLRDGFTKKRRAAVIVAIDDAAPF